MVDFLNSLFACDVDRLPTEFLVHKFWKDWNKDISSTALYAQCVIDNRLVRNHFNTVLHGHCGRRFGYRSEGVLLECHNLLHNATYRAASRSAGVSRDFAAYSKFIDTSLRPAVADRCLPLLQSACSYHPLRVVKVVRATMESMEQLLRRSPQTHIVHLVRDPRPVALSRRDYYASGHGLFADSERHNQPELMVREVSIYCRQVAADVRWRRRLEKQFPGRLYSLTYEELVNDPVGRAKDIYHLIGETPEQFVLDKFAKLAEGTRNQSAKWLATRWLDRLSQVEYDRINQHCSELLQMYPSYANATPHAFRPSR